MNLSTLFDRELIILDLPVTDAAGAIACLSGLMMARGYVRPSYPAAVTEREREFPTGLRMPDRAVAIPHTYAEHCLKPGIAVGRLQRPVPFGEMGSQDRIIDVDLVFQLSITDPRAQVGLLQALLELFQRPGFFGDLLAARAADEAYELLVAAAGATMAGKEVD